MSVGSTVFVARDAVTACRRRSRRSAAVLVQRRHRRRGFFDGFRLFFFLDFWFEFSDDDGKVVHSDAVVGR